MQRVEFFRKELVEELRRVENLMRKEASLEKKIFYYSAAYGITGRTFRYSFSKDVLLADFILQGTHRLLVERLANLKGGERLIPLEEKHFDLICDGLKLLTDKLESGENIQEPLEHILTTIFTVTGPGYYLQDKGDIKV